MVKRRFTISVKKEELFTVGQFARLHHINKHTLQLLLTLRELGMPVEEIQIYVKNRSPEALLKIITQQKKRFRKP